MALYSIHYAYEYDTSKAVTYVPQLNYNSLKDRVAARGLGIESHDRRLGNIMARERTTDGGREGTGGRVQTERRMHDIE